MTSGATDDATNGRHHLHAIHEHQRFDSYAYAEEHEEVNVPAAMGSGLPPPAELARIGSHLPEEPASVDVQDEKSENHLAKTIDVSDAEKVDTKDIYDKFSPAKKRLIVIVVSVSALLAPFTSSAFLPSIPQIANDLNVSQSVVNYTVAIFLVSIGVAPLVWAPYATIYGRRPIYLVSLPIFVVASIGVALSRSLVALIITRIIQGAGSSSVLSVGAGTIGDIYRPTERGRAMGVFYAGVLVGPSLAPLIAGIMTEYVPPVYPGGSWRAMQWLLAGAGLIALGLSFLLPETIHSRGIDKIIEEREVLRRTASRASEKRACADKSGNGFARFLRWRRRVAWVWVDPLRPVRLLRYPNVLAISLNSSFVLLTTYCVVVPLTYTLGPRYGITNDAILGTLFLAQGGGNMIGSRIAGHISDRTVRLWTDKRGKRIPEDRLRASLLSGAIIVPGSVLGAGLTMQFWTSAGGLAVSLIFLFISGVGLMGVLSVSNTYLVDVMQKRSAETIAINNCIRYIFAAAASAAVLPLIKAIGVAAANGIAAAISLIGFALTLATIRWGEERRTRVDEGEAAEQLSAAVEKGDAHGDQGIQPSRRTSITLRGS
ncbi:MFS general substrate transporter [Punctularia strigosozonata HHB-11173 SS5]|uniref:MFS general substrate transporter n=1 Tax=Punctularia strigosozonata (strain HHB-11173) TaxID=741275 RepID=UPI000441672A|nr:MFS general substrate transporter [Punctularia strigosozonata HHB-11173 SS5]EIN13032.1 MFS general substrate transporter [Punctularia strigosozonata HHB-11173 SS5]